MDSSRRALRLVIVTALALTYVAAGRLGLMLDAVAGFASLVWAPSGLSLAALCYFGPGVWPGVTVGAFVVNLLGGATLPVAAGIALGNTLEAVLGALLLTRAAPLRFPLRRLADVIAFVVVGGGVATMISATIGVSSLLLGDLIAGADVARTWTAWWVGDAVGTLVVGPLLLAWAPPRPAVSAGTWVELLGVTASVLIASAVIFLERDAFDAPAFLEPYLLLGPLLWAALRFETRGAAWAVFVTATVAVVGTAMGRGPLQGEALTERLWVLQAFIGLTAVIFMVLGALAAARSDAEGELRAAIQAAESSSSAKSRFLAVMSHELPTPLNGIIGYVSLLESGLREQATPSRLQHLQRIRAAAWHLTSVIEGILTFSRAEAGREELDLRAVDGAELVRETVALLEPEADRKGLVLTAAVHAPLALRSDPGKLRQILLNLIGNAVKFAERGRIVVEAAEDDRHVVFRVTDEGPGIAADRLQSIFVPFNRSSDEMAAALPGTGLGLSVCAMLARLMDGTLDVQSRLGEGSVFTLRVPKGAPSDHAVVA